MMSDSFSARIESTFCSVGAGILTILFLTGVVSTLGGRVSETRRDLGRFREERGGLTSVLGLIISFSLVDDALSFSSEVSILLLTVVESTTGDAFCELLSAVISLSLFTEWFLLREWV